MQETMKRSGGCHCGKVRYEVTASLDQVMSCNCSMCLRKGTVLTFVGKDQFHLLSGEEGLTDYQFNKKHIHHLFCATCGVTSFARGTSPDGKEMVAVNVRCLDDIDLGSLTVTPVDGKSF
ncbi:GFA family protein [Chondromyces crocatus]|uniref:Aldehyde-activating protein n=1 Tax=Chondromyces crocatus TaxID=52 RepID=A0A0K1EPT7_CHOCO|nr:aldehyde-activating protein [Chondromyces crocatus]